MIETAQTAVIRDVAERHGVMLDRDDPILIVQTGTAKLLEEALQAAKDLQRQTLAEHKQELEVVFARSHSELTASTTGLLDKLRTTTAAAVADAIATSTKPLMEQHRLALLRHERAVERSTLVCCVATAAALLAACGALAITLWQ